MSSLPNELIIMIAEFLNKSADINALARTNSRFYHLLNRYLYRHNVKYAHGLALVWAIKHDNIATARKAVETGASADEALEKYISPCYSPTLRNCHPVWVAPLALAMKLGRKEIVELLLAQDIDFTKPHKISYNTRSRMLFEYVLCKAVDNNDPALFHELLDRVPDILFGQASSYRNWRWSLSASQVIAHIVKARNLPLLEAFLNRGFSLPESQFGSKECLLKGSYDKTMLDFLLGRGLDCNLSRKEAFWLLETGMCRGSLAAIDYALGQYNSRYYSTSGSPLTFEDIEHGLAPRDAEWKHWYGCDEDDMQRTVQHLIDRGADPNPQTSRWAYDTVTDVLFYRHKTVMQTMIQGCYARGVTTAELNEGISSCPDIETGPTCSETSSKWWQKYLAT